jgi:hypothetical protein
MYFAIGLQRLQDDCCTTVVWHLRHDDDALQFGLYDLKAGSNNE